MGRILAALRQAHVERGELRLTLVLARDLVQEGDSLRVLSFDERQ